MRPLLRRPNARWRWAALRLASLLWLFSNETVGWCANDPVNWKRVKVLVYTKNGTGYVHDNIPYAVQSIQKLGAQYGFHVDVSDQPAVFTEDNLKKYTLLLFPSTNNDVFDTDAQRLAFRRYLEAGGGFVGVHSVVGTERNWTWFKQMLGGTFAWHAKFQKFRVNVIDPHHASVQGLPLVWERDDECYFEKEMFPGIRAVMAHDLTSLGPDDADQIRAHAGPYGTLYPTAWYQDFDGGHTWVTTLGHDKKDYVDPTFVQHLFLGIQYVAGRVKKVDFGRAYAKSRDAPVVMN